MPAPSGGNGLPPRRAREAPCCGWRRSAAMRGRSMRASQSWSVSRRLGSSVVDHLPYAREIARSHVTRSEQVADERSDVAVEQAFRELADHGVLDVRLADEGAVDVLLVARASRQDATALEARDDGGNGG